MLFDTKLDRHLMDYNYIGRYFHWRDAEHAMLFKHPNVYSDRWEKRISESHEQWKRDFGIDCDSDIIYEVGDEEVVQVDERRCIYYPLQVLYDNANCLIWVEVGAGVWSPCYNQIYAMRKKKDWYDLMYEKMKKRLDNCRLKENVVLTKKATLRGKRVRFKIV